jgi:hypothetical protein
MAAIRRLASSQIGFLTADVLISLLADVAPIGGPKGPRLSRGPKPNYHPSRKRRSRATRLAYAGEGECSLAQRLRG